MPATSGVNFATYNASLSKQERKALGILAVTGTHCIDLDSCGEAQVLSVWRFVDGKALTTMDKAVISKLQSKFLTCAKDADKIKACLNTLAQTGCLWEEAYKASPRPFGSLQTGRAEMSVRN
jgi:hypothetical protein